MSKMKGAIRSIPHRELRRTAGKIESYLNFRGRKAREVAKALVLSQTVRNYAGKVMVQEMLRKASEVEVVN